MTKAHEKILKKLQAGDEKFRLLVEKSPMAIFMHNGEKFIYVNSVLEKITGYVGKELIGKSFWSIVHPDYKQIVKARGTKRILNGKDIPSHYELKIICKNKDEKLIDMSATIIKYQGQTVVLGSAVDITESKKVENAFKESEYRFRTLVENSPFSIELHDKAGNLVKTNEAWEKLWGLKSSDAVGKFNILKDKQAKETGIDKYFKRAAKGEVVTLPDLKYDAVKAVGKGRSRWLRSTFYPINGRTDVVEYVVIVHIDITEQKISEETLRAKELLLSGINNNLQSAMIYQVKVFKDGLRQLTYVSDSVKKFYGVSPNQAMKNINLIYNKIIKEDGVRLQREETKAIKSKTIFKSEARVVDPKGNVRWSYFVSIPTSLKDGITVWDGIETDITDRKKNEEKIQMIFSAVKQSTEGMAIADLAGKLTFVNEAWCLMHGYKSYKDLVGKNLSVFHNKKQIENDVKPFNKRVEKFGTYSGEVGHMTRDGKIFPTLMTTTLLKDEKGKPYAIVGIAKDITEQKKVEEKLRVSEALLSETSRISKVGGWELDVKTLDLKWSEETYKIHEVDQSTFIPTLKSAIGFYSSGSKLIIEKAVNRAIKYGESFDVDLEIITAKGNHVQVHAIGKLTQSKNGTKKISGTFQDITEKKQDEQKIIKLNKVLTSIKEITQSIFQINDKEKLLKKVCESIFKYAYKMVWIGVCNEETKKIIPIAQAGFEKGYLDSINVRYDSSKYGKGPTGTAVRTGKTNMMNNIITNPNFKPWKEEAKKRGYHSSIAIPIFNSYKVIGALNIYSAEMNIFDKSEIALLEELSHDISIALRGLENAEKLKESEAKYRILAERSRDGIAIVGMDGKMKYSNPFLANLLGYKIDEIVGQDVLKFTHPNFHQLTIDVIEKFKNGLIDIRFEASLISKDGRQIDIEDTVGAVEYEGEKCGLVLVRDITERKKFDEILREKENRYRGLFETSRDAVMTLEPPSWKFTSANSKTLEAFDAKNEAQFLSYPPWKLSPKLQPDGESSDKKAKAMINLAMKNGSNLFEWIHKKINGEEFLAEVFLSRVESGSNVFLQAIVRDITKQKLSEEKIVKKTLDLERLNRAMVGREKKMIDLKKELDALKRQVNNK